MKEEEKEECHIGFHFPFCEVFTFSAKVERE